MKNLAMLTLNKTAESSFEGPAGHQQNYNQRKMLQFGGLQNAQSRGSMSLNKYKNSDSW